MPWDARARIFWTEVHAHRLRPARTRRARRSRRFGARKRHDAEHSLEELAGLAEAAGANVVLQMIQERPTPDPATFIGSGKLDELAAECARVAGRRRHLRQRADPAQLRQIEERVDRKVIDRTQLILDIFARRARTREGKWQVELAQLKYLLPRLVGSGTALSRLGGGIGTRGPGETKLETDRRRIRQRIHAISQRDRLDSAAAPAFAGAPPESVGAAGRAGRLHQRGQDDAVQSADEGDRPRRPTRCS